MNQYQSIGDVEMKTDDLYGMTHDSLEQMRHVIESILCIKFMIHESLYHGGKYYLYEGRGDERFTLKRNIDLLENEPEEPEFHEFKVLLLVEGGEHSQEIYRLLAAIPGIRLLRRDEW